MPFFTAPTADHDDEVTRWDDSVGRHARRCRAGRGARARRKARLKTGDGRRGDVIDKVQQSKSNQ